jgi:hypothetical protein
MSEPTGKSGLLPCPICGSDAKDYTRPRERDLWPVCCTSHHCLLNHRGIPRGAWQTLPRLSSAVMDVVEEMEAAIEDHGAGLMGAEVWFAGASDWASRLRQSVSAPTGAKDCSDCRCDLEPGQSWPLCTECYKEHTAPTPSPAAKELADELRRFAGDRDWEHDDGTPVDLRGIADRLSRIADRGECDKPHTQDGLKCPGTCVGLADELEDMRARPAPPAECEKCDRLAKIRALCDTD